MDNKMDNNIEVKYAFSYIINWIWYLKYHVTEAGLVHIHEYRRFHGSNMNHVCFNNDEIMQAYNVHKTGYPKDGLIIREDGDRVIYSVGIIHEGETKYYDVENPKHIFRY